MVTINPRQITNSQMKRVTMAVTSFYNMWDNKYKIF